MSVFSPMRLLFMNASRRFAILSTMLLICSQVAIAAELKGVDKADEAAIRATADEFVQAFNRADSKAVAALWTENGTMADDRGQIFKGRNAIEEEYAAFFKKYPGAHIEIAVQSVDFPTSSLAIEDGLARVMTKNSQPPIASRYTAVHLLQDGKWLMASVRESSIELPSTYGHLQELEWMVGNWETKTDGTVVQTNIRWLANNSFLEREYTVRQNSVTTSSGVQIIGWDPQAGQIRSWSFDGSGGHGTALWSAVPDGWRIESTGILNNGTPTSSKDFLLRIPGENNVFGWRSMNRMAGVVSLPDMPEVVLERSSEKH
jgi:uncharacterized protein (TIGR02246 family)